MSRETIAAFGAGVVFAVGLVLSGMTQPAKVIGFLDLFGNWDPSLAFVMGGALAVYFPLYRLVIRRPTPVYGAGFLVPSRTDVDGRLIAGSALFGVGWGLGGFCPGPGIVALSSGASEAIVFVAAMAVGMVLHQLLGMRRRQAAS